MKLWQKILIAILLLTLVGYLVFAMLRFSDQSNNKKCLDIAVTILDGEQIHFLTSEMIYASLLNNDFEFKGERLSDINTQEVEAFIKKNPVVKTVECYKTPSGLVKIDITQRQPLFRVNALVNFYVDADGKIMPISPNFVAYVPIVSGCLTVKYAVGELKDFMLFIQNDEFWNAQIEQVDVNCNKELVLIPRVGDYEIELGTLEEYQVKMQKLKTFYLEGLNKIGWGNYSKISLKYKDQVVCTKK